MTPPRGRAGFSAEALALLGLLACVPEARLDVSADAGARTERPCLFGDVRRCAKGGLLGVCAEGMQSCRVDGSWSSCTTEPRLRSCNDGLDFDCDGARDDALDATCRCGGLRPAAAGAPIGGTCGRGACRQQARACVVAADLASSDWGPASVNCSATSGVAELCNNNEDDDCDGRVDEGCSDCPDLPGPAMVRLPEGYCIDNTEVTQAQYRAWLDQGPSPDAQSMFCAWNTDFSSCARAGDCTQSPSGHYSPGTNDDHPVTHVDWCDAQAYCRAAGKRLCGKIGGGPTGYDAYADASVSQWQNACSAGGQNAMPVVGACQKCNMGSQLGRARPVAFPLPPQEMPLPAGAPPEPPPERCQSDAAYAGVFDLAGNVWEWEDSCQGDVCRVRGGSYSSSCLAPCDAQTDPDFAGPPLARARRADIGFRCCWEP